LITGGRVIDGTGNPWFLADVGIRNGKIAMVGHCQGATADRTLDARGKYVVPGFIDMHSHADDGGVDHGLRDASVAYRTAPNLVMQGITTVVVNADGSSPWPISKQRKEMEQAGIGLNVVLMIGHNSIRELALGENPRRAATAGEIAKMQAMVRQGMQDGAFGLTTGLEYFPGTWSTTEEIVALTREVAPFGGFYSEHERSSGDAPMWWKPSYDSAAPTSLVDSVKETIEIGERTGVPVVLTHMKARGINSWGTSRTVIQLVEQARQRGVQVWGDQYPYTSSGSDGALLLIPGWATPVAQDAPAGKRDYASALRKTMADANALEKLHLDIAHEIEFRGGADNIVVFAYPDKKLIGKNLAELARERHVSPIDMAIALQLEGFSDRPGGAWLRSFSFSEDDVDAFMSQPWVATSTDAGISLPGDRAEDVHPRFYGSYPRKLRRYVFDRKVLSLESAIRSSTSLPAQIIGLHTRGQIHEGFAADVVVFDPARIRDLATFSNPTQYAEGVGEVFVNGKLVVENEKVTGVFPGRVLTRAGD
jgi:N-acyl-D-amino-acid deacylase